MRRNLTLGALLAGLCVVAAAASLLLSGCGLAKAALNIENPRYSIREIRPRIDIALPLSASTIDFDFSIEVDNPNSVGLRLDEIDFDLFINDSRILDGVSQQRINIPANGRGDMRLRTSIGYQNLRTLWTEVVNAINGQRARYEIRGNAYYDTPLGRLKFPVSVYSNR